jgi:hypothetical protein
MKQQPVSRLNSSGGFLIFMKKHEEKKFFMTMSANSVD